MLGLSITRTANAGVLIEMDNKKILIDGICNDYPPYIGTPAELKAVLTTSIPDVVAFTHKHLDHYDLSYAKLYNEKTLRSTIGPESLNFYKSDGVEINSVITRHIGKSDILHFSYVIKGSKTIWFMGDASPVCLSDMPAFSNPDILIVPFAYAITKSAWQKAKDTGAKKIVLVHMPLKTNDEVGLWGMVEKVTCNEGDLILLNVGEKIKL